jgi:hypothetical protein
MEAGNRGDGGKVTGVQDLVAPAQAIGRSAIPRRMRSVRFQVAAIVQSQVVVVRA